MSLPIVIMGPSRPWSDRYLFSLLNAFQRLSTWDGLTVLKAKIIDLGLAKPINELLSQAAISTPGVFAGTPEFASPEQFAGVAVDIRSDLYSLGVTLLGNVDGQDAIPWHSW
ncbi:MAG: hypothetical protein JO207_05540 [Verrucomicrobia bacterium]|nr:hypothetical protein [Verrucomicrobiota bacterium]